MPRTSSPPPPTGIRLLLALSLAAAVLNIVGAHLELGWLRQVTAWLYLPPLMIALVLATGLRDARSRWWLLGLVLCWFGDGLGGQGFLILLGCFLLGHLAYLVALWPTRSASWLGDRRGLLHWGLLLVGMVLVVPHAEGLRVPVVLYGLVLTLMAVLATTGGAPGLAGGLLFMVSDLTLGWGRFAGDLSEAAAALLVIGTYVPAQVLLLVAFLRIRAAEALPQQGTDR